MLYYNTVIYITMIVFSYLLARKLKLNAIIGTFLIYLMLFLTCEFVEFTLNIPIWNQTERTANCYNWFEKYLAKGYDKDKDYSEGIFNEDYSISLKEATQKKYDYIFDKLQLKPGMKLLDAGCGTGVWMDYCRQRQVDVVGLTLSEEQAKAVRKKGLTVHVMDYRILNKAFLNQFDRITALGSSEHVCSSRGSLLKNVARNRSNQTLINTWGLLGQYLKPEGKMYLTLLTINPDKKWSIFDWGQTYVLERHYGGYYPSIDDIFDIILPAIGFEVRDLQDKTKDYHYSSIADKDHFGHWKIKWDEDPFKKITTAVSNILTDPFFSHHWLYYHLDTWMWQFGGYQESPLSDTQVAQSPTQLKYLLLEKNKLYIWNIRKNLFI